MCRSAVPDAGSAEPEVGTNSVSYPIEERP